MTSCAHTPKAGTNYMPDENSSNPEAAATRLAGYLSHLDELKAKGLTVSQDADIMAGRKSPLATKNLLEVTDGLRRPPLEGGGGAIHQ